MIKTCKLASLACKPYIYANFNSYLAIAAQCNWIAAILAAILNFLNSLPCGYQSGPLVIYNLLRITMRQQILGSVPHPLDYICFLNNTDFDTLKWRESHPCDRWLIQSAESLCKISKPSQSTLSSLSRAQAWVTSWTTTTALNKPVPSTNVQALPG